MWDITQLIVPRVLATSSLAHQLYMYVVGSGASDTKVIYQLSSFAKFS